MCVAPNNIISKLTVFGHILSADGVNGMNVVAFVVMKLTDGSMALNIDSLTVQASGISAS